MPEKENILKTALETVIERGSDYGSADENMQQTADLINATFGTEFTAADVALIMVLVKVSREAYKPNKDNLVDIAGYAWVKSQCT